MSTLVWVSLITAKRPAGAQKNLLAEQSGKEVGIPKSVYELRAPAIASVLKSPQAGQRSSIVRGMS